MISKERIFFDPSSTIALLGGMKLISVKYEDVILTTKPSAVLPSFLIVIAISSLPLLTDVAESSHIQNTLGAVLDVISNESTKVPSSKVRTNLAEPLVNASAFSNGVIFNRISVLFWLLERPIVSCVISKYIPLESRISSR